MKTIELNNIKPGEVLKIVLNTYDITEDELIKYALISKHDLHFIIHGNNLIPYSIAIYLQEKTNIPLSLWNKINDIFCKNKCIKYNGVELGYQLLLNKILFEKDTF